MRTKFSKQIKTTDKVLVSNLKCVKQLNYFVIPTEVKLRWSVKLILVIYEFYKYLAKEPQELDKLVQVSQCQLFRRVSQSNNWKQIGAFHIVFEYNSRTKGGNPLKRQIGSYPNTYLTFQINVT